MVESHIEYPTDIRLLFDSVRKVSELLGPLCILYGIVNLVDKKQIKVLKKRFNKLSGLNHSNAKDETKKQAQAAKIKATCEAYLEQAHQLLKQADRTLDRLRQRGAEEVLLAEIKGFRDYGVLFLGQVKRRIIEGETIPHEEKVFSIFKPYTQWINKGKAGVPVELGLNVCVVEDQHQFILYHQVMEPETDEQMAVIMVDETQSRFPTLNQCSFDRGFHSPANQEALAERLDYVVLPKKGKLSEVQLQHQSSPKFRAARSSPLHTNLATHCRSAAEPAARGRNPASAAAQSRSSWHRAGRRLYVQGARPSWPPWPSSQPTAAVGWAVGAVG